MRFRTSILVLTLVVAASSAATAQATQASAPAPRSKPAQLPADSMEIGRKATMWLYAAQFDSLVAHMDSTGRSQPDRAKAQLESQATQLAARAGTEVKVIEEKYITRNGARQYWRTATFSNLAEPVVVRFIVTSKGELAGLGMNPASQTPPIDP